MGKCPSVKRTFSNSGYSAKGQIFKYETEDVIIVFQIDQKHPLRIFSWIIQVSNTFVW